jgi:membrane associated rhomboid family serine protease
MIIPIRTDYRMTRKPWANYALLAANIAVYFLGFNAAGRAASQRVQEFMLQPDDPELVQFFTCMFLHGGLMHLLGNMVFLWVFGGAMNDKFGQAGYLAFYLAGGVLAGVGYILLGGAQPVVGASGAISAVAGAYLVLLPRTRITVLALLLYVLLPFDLSSLYFLLFQFAWNLALTLFNIGGEYAAAGGIAYAAHSAGYLYGIGVSAILLAAKVLPRDAYDLLNLIRAGHRRAEYRRMVNEGYDPFSYLNPKLRADGSRRVTSRSVASRTPEGPAARELELRREIGEAFAANDLPRAGRRYLELVQIADDPVLSRQQQLDVSNFLMSDEQHAAAADAYQRFLSHYGDYEHLADIYLMLGLLYGRYLHQYDRAESCLNQAMESLHDPRKVELARSELAEVRRTRGN